MKDSSFKVVQNVYKLISLVDLSTVNVPNRERKMLDKLEASMFDLVEIVCTANNLARKKHKNIKSKKPTQLNDIIIYIILLISLFFNLTIINPTQENI